MDLKEKYADLVNYVQKAQVDNLSVNEKNGVLHISGTTDNATKKEAWDIYNRIDPDMRSSDMVLDIKSNDDDEKDGDKVYEIKSGDNLSKIAQKYPGMTWQKIYEANKDIIKDPNVIYPGQKLKIPH